MGALMKNRKLYMHKNCQSSLLHPRQKDKGCQSTQYSIDFFAPKFSTQIIFKVKNTLLPIVDHEKKRDVGNPMLLP